jgi:SAM-dependent methyltransferase
VKLLCDLGFQASGVDISGEGLRHCEAWLASAGQGAELRQASMRQLPFPDDAFDAALSFGVFYYASAAGMKEAVRELHRVLRPGGLAFVVVRTDADYRFGKGVLLEPYTFRLEIEDTNERGCVVHFLREEDVVPTFRAFREIQFEKTETTFANRQAVNSDWLVEVRKRRDGQEASLNVHRPLPDTPAGGAVVTSYVSWCVPCSRVPTD